MPKLKCDVRSCIYNANLCCCRSVIRVIGEEAKMDRETACASFHRRKRVNLDEEYKMEFSKIDGINEYISIECESRNCIYNKNEICSATKVKIGGGKQASRYVDTICNTFKLED